MSGGPIYGVKGTVVADRAQHERIAAAARSAMFGFLDQAHELRFHPASGLLCLALSTRAAMKEIAGPAADDLMRAILEDREDIEEVERRYVLAGQAGYQRMREGGGRPS